MQDRGNPTQASDWPEIQHFNNDLRPLLHGMYTAITEKICGLNLPLLLIKHISLNYLLMVQALKPSLKIKE